MLAVNPKIHSSKSNPNLINNELALVSNNSTNNNINNTNTNNNSALTSLAQAGGIVVTVSPVINQGSSNSPKTHPKNLSTSSISINNNNNSNEENLFRINFYQEAKLSKFL